MFQLSYDYETCIAGSERANWRIDEVLPAETYVRLDRDLMPGEIVESTALSWLDDRGARALNQITGHAYANLFAYVEEYILATMIDQAREQVHQDHDAVRALLRVAEEEVKHQHLFERYRACFQGEFGHACEVLQSAREVATRLLQYDPLAVMIFTLHLELATQQHYTQNVRSRQDLEPHFQNMLKAHWMEEAQHARIDALELKRMVTTADPATVDAAFTQYFEMLQALSALLREQAAMDTQSVQNALGATFDHEQRSELLDAQHRAYNKLFIGHGTTNRTFIKLLTMVSPEQAEAVRTFAV